MTYEMYRYIFLGGLIASCIFFVITVVLFFVLRIPKVFSDLTGRTARKAIESIRLQNEQTGDKSYKSSPVNMQRGKLTDKMTRSGRIVQRGDTPFGTGVITEKISTQQLPPEEPAGETTVLGADETTVLSAEAGETTVLDAPEAQPQVFAIEFEITYIHTSEVIA